MKMELPHSWLITLKSQPKRHQNWLGTSCRLMAKTLISRDSSVQPLLRINLTDSLRSISSMMAPISSMRHCSPYKPRRMPYLTPSRKTIKIRNISIWRNWKSYWNPVRCNSLTCRGSNTICGSINSSRISPKLTLKKYSTRKN